MKASAIFGGMDGLRRHVQAALAEIGRARSADVRSRVEEHAGLLPPSSVSATLHWLVATGHVRRTGTRRDGYEYEIACGGLDLERIVAGWRR